MSRHPLYGMTIVMSLMLAASVQAQTTTREQAACPLPPESRGDGAAAPAVGALPQGCETSTLPWSAPVGHRQPQTGEVTASMASSIDRAVMEENAKVNRLIKGVCRGC